MRVASRVVCVLVAAVGVQACAPVPYDPATNTDTTPATPVVLRVDASTTVVNSVTGRPELVTASFEARDRIVGQPQNVRGTVGEDTYLDVLSTATDNESGIREVTVKLNRTVFFIASNGSLASTQFPSIVVATASYTPSNGRLPRMGAANYRTHIGGERRFTNAQGNTLLGTGVVLQYFAEAKNGAGMIAFTDTVTVTSGRVQ